MQADLPLTAAIRQSQQTLYHSHPQHSADRQGEPPRADRAWGQTRFGELPYSPQMKKYGPSTPKIDLLGDVLCGARFAGVMLPPLCPLCLPAVRVSPCHSRQPSIISDASAAEGDRSSTPSDINSPRHRTHSLCNVRHCVMGGVLLPRCLALAGETSSGDAAGPPKMMLGLGLLTWRAARLGFIPAPQ